MRTRRSLRQVAGPLLTIVAVTGTILLLTADNTARQGLAANAVTGSDEVINIPPQEAKRLVREAARRSEERARRVQEVCARHHQGLYRSASAEPDFKEPPVPNYQVFYFDRQRRTAWCPLYKAGSSSWLANMILLAGYTEGQLKNATKQLSEIAREFYPMIDVPEAEEVLQRSIKMLVVRHPFARLLSAYRDKLEHNTPERARHGAAHFYRAYGKKIVDKFRKPGDRNETLEPTFREFVQYLINENLVLRSDDHWIPYYLFCTPCLLRYDMIAAVETYVGDQVWMLHALGVQDQIKPRWRHKLRDTSKRIGPPSLDREAPRYFSQLTSSELYALYEKYKLDFELFGYRMEDYLPFVSDHKRDDATF